MLDLQNITLAGLAAIGAVNVLTMFKPGIESKYKFLASLVVAFICTFVPTDLGNVILDHIKTSLEIAFAASGVYKLATKAGGLEEK